ncbi:hypothetical protein PUN28_017340 [Cardiocondyla obscurior]|uniref:Uncharacterized protein n=1 Tax=Cardiocondyla obscurior TaxID=286306 RepID=A0AAW2EP49_9HYME
MLRNDNVTSRAQRRAGSVWCELRRFRNCNRAGGAGREPHLARLLRRGRDSHPVSDNGLLRDSRKIKCARNIWHRGRDRELTGTWTIPYRGRDRELIGSDKIEKLLSFRNSEKKKKKKKNASCKMSSEVSKKKKLKSAEYMNSTSSPT